MNVFQQGTGEMELIGTTSLAIDDARFVVDLDIGGGEALRLVYTLDTVPCLTPQMTLGAESAVILSPGQTPDFLPDWEALP